MLKRDEQGNLVESTEGRESLFQNTGVRTDADDMLASRYEDRNKKYLDRVRNISPVLESESGEHPLESEQYSFPGASPQPNGSDDERLKRLEIPENRTELLSDDSLQIGFWAKIEAEAAGGGGEYDQWTEQTLDSSGVFINLTDGRDETTTGLSLFEANDLEDIAVDTIVWVWETDEADGDIAYRFLMSTSINELLDGINHTDTYDDGTNVTRGDLITGQVIGVDTKWKRLAKGASQSLLYMSTNDPAWLAKGSNGAVLTVNSSGNLAWLSPPAGPAVLCYDATSGVHWLALSAAYHGAFRSASSTMESTPQKATA